MRKAVATVFCFWIFSCGAQAASSKAAEPVKTLPPIVTQAYGAAGTIIMCHDINDDGKVDYKATYIYKDGRLQQIGSNMLSQDGIAEDWKK